MLYYSEGERDQGEQTDLQEQLILRSITVCRKSSRCGKRPAWQRGEYVFELRHTHTQKCKEDGLSRRNIKKMPESTGLELGRPKLTWI